MNDVELNSIFHIFKKFLLLVAQQIWTNLFTLNRIDHFAKTFSTCMVDTNYQSWKKHSRINAKISKIDFSFRKNIRPNVIKIF